MNAIKAVIFDMDGVIVDSKSHHERAYLEVVQALGYGNSHGLLFADYIGRSDEVLWRDFIARHQPRQTYEELLDLKTQRVVEIIRREKPFFDGLPELVGKLAARYTLALASGSERRVVAEVLRLDDLGRFFSAVVTGSDVKHGKPAPDIFLRAAALLNVAPRECWVIEDAKTGVAAGIAAGMQVVAITNTYRADELAHATRVVSTYGEIEQLLLPSA
jgi:HAD superfamily hydrolase (TIGR01509 family)